ncbi:MAG: hypothetical protein LUE92_03650 [Clostridiales bacterium]|nr:hypothetical protein [Clostridiales bacterium]
MKIILHKLLTGMRPSKKTYQMIPVLLLAAVLFCGTSLTVFAAADSASLDWSMSGKSSITVEMTDEDGNAVTAGALTLYQVASLSVNDGNFVYTYTDAFANCGLSLESGSSSADSQIADASGDMVTLAADLADYVSESGISGTAVANTDGTVTFDNLTFGLYLIVQTADAEGYESVNPFVVTLPLSEDGAWVYAVDASPKMGTLTPDTETPGEPGDSEEPEDSEEPGDSEEPQGSGETGDNPGDTADTTPSGTTEDETDESSE